MVEIGRDYVKDCDKWNVDGRINGLPILNGVLSNYDVVMTNCGEIMIISDIDKQRKEINVLARNDCQSNKERPYKEKDTIFVIGKANY